MSSVHGGMSVFGLVGIEYYVRQKYESSAELDQRMMILPLPLIHHPHYNHVKTININTTTTYRFLVTSHYPIGCRRSACTPRPYISRDGPFGAEGSDDDEQLPVQAIFSNSSSGSAT